MSILITSLALLPFVLLFILIIFLKWPAIKAMPIVWFITALSALIVWKLSPLSIFASFIKGTLLSFEIMLIIFGAVWIIEILKEKKQIHSLQNFLSSISPDARIQAIIIAWAFGSLIEGIAGFGTPAALAAPLLVSLGFTPILAVTLALIANSTAVSFGAAGTPILLGLGPLGFNSSTISQITQTTAFLHLISSIIIPLALIYFVVSHSKKSPGEKKWKSILPAIPFAIFSWLVFIIPYFLIAKYMGPELPSIMAGLIGLIIISTAAHFNFLTPKKTISFSHKRKHSKQKLSKTIFSLFPYFLIVLFLSLSRTIPPIKNFLSNISLNWSNILGENISYSFLPLFTPSFFFILSGLICIIIYKASSNQFSKTLSKTFNKVKYPTLALIFAIALVQLFLITNNNPVNLPSMPLILAKSASTLFQEFYVILAPFVGAFGSFIAGSNTVSNLLFGSFQAETAKALGLSMITLLSLQVVGGAIGNMIAIHNVLAASATVNLKNQEGKIIRKTLGVALIYAILVGLTAFLFLA
jgi:lactate permease